MSHFPSLGRKGLAATGLVGTLLAASCGDPESSATGPVSGTGGASGTGASSGAGASSGGGATAGSAGSSSAPGGSSSSGGAGSGATAGSSGASDGGGSGGQPPTGGKCAGGVADGRAMECLDRGVVAVPSEGNVFVSWRLFGTDPTDVGFNLYRKVGTEESLVCSTGASEATSCLDDEPSDGASYFVRPVVGGVEGEPSGAASVFAADYLRIPLEPAPEEAHVHLAWVGDLDGDGELDYVVDRISAAAPLVDAYSRHGEFLWRANTGPLGANQDNIEGGATTISNGHWDGLTVFDFDGDGSAEVAIKTANGFVFGDGTALEHDNDEDQFVSILSGTTGAELARAPLPDDFIAEGPLQCHFGAGYLDGARPSVITKCKNRVDSGAFNLVATAFDFDGANLVQRWKYVRDESGGSDYHQIRILDVDGDGKDELADGGYVIDDDGSVLYSLAPDGVVHGDRFHITDMDPNRPGLEGWGIQQDNANGLETYYYDAKTGEILRKYANPSGAGGDMGRGTVADLFPDQPGFEYFSFNGLYAAPSGDLVVEEVSSNVPWPNFAMQWDGDVGSELLDNNRVGDWNLTAKARNTYSWRRTFEGLVQARGAIPFYGDVFGDWREEALLETSDHAELRVYTTTYETDVRLYTLLHNPQYRNELTTHGYKQSHHVDYYLGFDMAAPSPPAIRLVDRP